ncbi:NADPH:quinone reductase-like Zn-dependent oxidoreductase [Paenibacillus sp. V4I3]|uniref:NAD(P)-dependent alcohol dehydrogenase n=1 Tax=Paenibacillus sp. V4I3 TaxID=3042305 RepID=UPI00278B3893|nr:NAD(P)-dependent alcohol dehydrogenase [Paenibacillus sp. V4I3]MDQ0876172.1 NADPH:quinone reductase-like Zn-dependent oxidoreductase [Paenibacillus sp. V4I3]
MKAIVCTKYGSPDVLQLMEVEKPTPKDNEVRIRVCAATVGPADCAFRKGDPYIVRLIYGLRKPRNPILGFELAGEIEAVGKDVQLYKEGDQVFGLSAKISGTHAEYKCLPEDAPLAIKSSSMSYEEAVAVVDGATTALTFLRDKAKIQSGQKVLINGASGSVGIHAIQLAKFYGAEVTGVCSSTNISLVKSLGADKVIDYTKEDFTQASQSYDVIFDAVGKRSFAQCKGSLTQSGVYLSTVPTLSIVLQMLWTSMIGGKKAIFVTAGLIQNKENLIFLKELYESGKIKSVIDQRYPLEQTAEAHRYVDKGHKKGSVVITIGHNSRS